MRHEAPQPPELGERDGLAYALFRPDSRPGDSASSGSGVRGDPADPERPSAGILIVHGAGSAKESHFDFARVARANGLAALCFDQRGHGRSSGAWGPTSLDDVATMCGLLREHVDEIALRGSSMGGFCAIHAAAADRDVAAVVALCPMPEDFLLRGLRRGTLEGFRIDADAAGPWLESLDLREAAARLAPETSLLLLHAEGDEQIPYAASEELHAVAGEPKRLLIVPGGHHRSLQHDLELQAVSVRFVTEAVRRRRRA